MDLFAAITEDIKPNENLHELAQEAASFVAALGPTQLRLLRDLQKGTDFELWHKTARATQTFAFEKGLEKEWWAVMAELREKLKDAEYTVGWDAAFDYVAAHFVKPWVGTSFSSKSYELMTKPLTAAGFQEKVAS